MRIRAVTLNLLHGAPIPGARAARSSLEARLEWTAEHLAKEAPDVVMLQEACAGAGLANTAETLAGRLGMDFVYARANPTRLLRALAPRGLTRHHAFEEGPAVLSRLPIVSHRVHRLSRHGSPFERRIALEAVLEGPTETFSVFSVHLTAMRPSRRRRQIAALVEAVNASPHAHPVIVGGDFNAEEHAHEIRLLTGIEGWLDSFRHVHREAAGHTWGQRLTNAAATAGRRIDFLFSAPAGDEHWDPTGSRLILDRAFPHGDGGVLWASDHYGVLTDFEAPSNRRSTAE